MQNTKTVVLTGEALVTALCLYLQWLESASEKISDYVVDTKTAYQNAYAASLGEEGFGKGLNVLINSGLVSVRESGITLSADFLEAVNRIFGRNRANVVNAIPYPAVECSEKLTLVI